MAPFQEFRLWAHRAPAGERASAAVAFLVAAAVCTWLLVPSKPSAAGAFSAANGASAVGDATGGSAGTKSAAAGAASTTGTAGAGPAEAAGATAAGSSGASAGETQQAANPGTGAGSTTGAQAGGASCPQGRAPGVSATQIKLAVILVNIAGPAANSVFGVSTPEKQKAHYEAAIKAVNAAGGSGCRRIVAQYFDGNPADQSQLQQTCLDVQEAGAFAVVDGGAYSQFSIVDCYARAHIAYFGGYLITRTQQQKFYPYLFDFNTYDSIYHDTVLALKSRKFFDVSNGFKKLGFVYRSCDGVMIARQKQLLASVVGSSKLVTYDVGCPGALASPSDIQQAVLTFQREGVTHVTTAAFVGDFANFTRVAQRQGFKPKYGLPDDALVSLTSGGGQAPDYDNIADAIAISATRSGDETTPGTKPNPGTIACNAAFKKYGDLGDVYKLPQDAGNSCGLLTMFDAAVDHAPALQSGALAAGLQASKSVDWSFPQGPNDFTGEGVTTGGQFWRPLQFRRSCNCWQIVERAFKPGF